MELWLVELWLVELWLVELWPVAVRPVEGWPLAGLLVAPAAPVAPAGCAVLVAEVIARVNAAVRAAWLWVRALWSRPIWVWVGAVLIALRQAAMAASEVPVVGVGVAFGVVVGTPVEVAVGVEVGVDAVVGEGVAVGVLAVERTWAHVAVAAKARWRSALTLLCAAARLFWAWTSPRSWPEPVRAGAGRWLAAGAEIGVTVGVRGVPVVVLLTAELPTSVLLGPPVLLLLLVLLFPLFPLVLPVLFVLFVVAAVVPVAVVVLAVWSDARLALAWASAASASTVALCRGPGSRVARA